MVHAHNTALNILNVPYINDIDFGNSSYQLLTSAVGRKIDCRQVVNTNYQSSCLMRPFFS